MAESYSVEAVLSATDKNFSKTMKGAVGSGITPACAGNTNGQALYLAWLEDHPRMCG